MPGGDRGVALNPHVTCIHKIKDRIVRISPAILPTLAIDDPVRLREEMRVFRVLCQSQDPKGLTVWAPGCTGVFPVLRDVYLEVTRLSVQPSTFSGPLWKGRPSVVALGAKLTR